MTNHVRKLSKYIVKAYSFRRRSIYSSHWEINMLIVIFDTFCCKYYNTFTVQFIHSFIHSFIHLFVRPSGHLFIHSLNHYILLSLFTSMFIWDTTCIWWVFFTFRFCKELQSCNQLFVRYFSLLLFVLQLCYCSFPERV